MDAARFDRLTRTISLVRSRRAVVSAIALGVLGIPSLVEAKKHKKKKKKIKFNDFGCVNVGGFCKNAGQCCSGICQGKKDKKKCKAHDTSTCQAGQQELGCGGAVNVLCTSSSGEEGQCDTTTGNAAFCTVDGGCFACTKDVECQPFCGPAAACIQCAGGECAAIGGTACVGPSDCTVP